MSTLNKEKLIEEIIDAAVYQQEGSEDEKYLYKIADALESIPENQIPKWVAVNKESLTKYLPDDASLWQYANGPDPQWIDQPLDIQKMFNDKDIVYNWKNKTDDQLKTVAELNGVSPEQLKSELEKQSLIQSRKDNMWPEWAFGHSVMNPIMNMLQLAFTPRLYEKRLREGVDTDIFTNDKGEFDPSFLLDFGENALYAIPYTKALGAIKPIGRMLSSAGKAGKVGRAGMFIGENTINPLIMEGADALSYDDPENERSNFSWTDVATGAGVNMGAPLLMKTGASGLARVFSGSGKPDRGMLKAIYEFGEGGADEVMRDIKSQNAKYDVLKTKMEKNGVSSLDVKERKFLEEYPRDQFNDEVLEKIMSQDGKSFQEKVSNYIKTLDNNEIKTLQVADAPMEELKGQTLLPVKKMPDGSIVPVDGPKTIVEKETQSLKAIPHEDKAKQAADDIVPVLENSPYAQLDDKTLKSSEQVMKENMIKNYGTNKYGDLAYDRDRASSLPGIGTLIGVLKKRDDEAQEQDAKQQAQKKLRVKSQKEEDLELDSIIEQNQRFWDFGMKPWSGEKPSPEMEKTPEVKAYRKWEKMNHDR